MTKICVFDPIILNQTLKLQEAIIYHPFLKSAFFLIKIQIQRQAKVQV